MAVYSRSSIQNNKNRRFWIWKKNAFLNLINNKPDIDKIYSYAKGLYEAKYQFSINKREITGSKYLNDPIALVEYSNDMQDVYKHIDEYNEQKTPQNVNSF